MITPTDEKRYTETEFWAFVEASDLHRRHELIRGEVFDLLGSSANHNSVVTNMATLLNQGLPETCRVFGPDIWLKSEAAEGYLCPDVSVVCPPVDFFQERTHVITNPELIVEVLSPSTADYDRGEKWGFYQAIPSLQDYVLINQDRHQLALYHRTGPQRWDYQLFHGPEAEVVLPSNPLSFPLGELFRRVVWE